MKNGCYDFPTSFKDCNIKGSDFSLCKRSSKSLITTDTTDSDMLEKRTIKTKKFNDVLLPKERELASPKPRKMKKASSFKSILTSMSLKPEDYHGKNLSETSTDNFLSSSLKKLKDLNLKVNSGIHEQQQIFEESFDRLKVEAINYFSDQTVYSGDSIALGTVYPKFLRKVREYKMITLPQEYSNIVCNENCYSMTLNSFEKFQTKKKSKARKQRRKTADNLDINCNNNHKKTCLTNRIINKKEIQKNENVFCGLSIDFMNSPKRADSNDLEIESNKSKCMNNNDCDFNDSMSNELFNSKAGFLDEENDSLMNSPCYHKKSFNCYPESPTFYDLKEWKDGVWLSRPDCYGIEESSMYNSNQDS